MQRNIQYENRIVLFMDLLGFKHIVNSTINNSDCVKHIRNIIIFIRRRLKQFSKTFPSAFVTQFSDSIVVSFQYGERGISLALLDSLRRMQKDLILKYGVICRGGITIGRLYHKKNIIFGPAMNEAYMLESELAIYPRIILSEALLPHITDFPDKVFTNYEEVNRSYIKSCIVKDTDKYYYIDYFSYKEFGNLPTIEKQYMEKLYTLITEALSNNKDNKVKQKYQWMADKYNHWVTQLKQMKPVEAFGISIGYDASKDKWYKSLKYIDYETNN